MGRLGFFKVIFAGILCNLYRLLRFIPNNDPVMGAMLPFSKKSPWVSGAFAALTMASFDLITGTLGIWTIVTSITYGLLGVAFGFAYGRMKRVGMREYLASGIIGVIAFDFITGPVASSFFFKIGFWEALLGQVPFTLLHLLSVTFFVALLVPLLDRTIIENRALEDGYIGEKLGLSASGQG